ncbi:MAG: C40 family peptidase [Saprospiraceae bacterium]|nr:C40 family peptidase [Saprospiraceae bacterium]
MKAAAHSLLISLCMTIIIVEACSIAKSSSGSKSAPNSAKTAYSSVEMKKRQSIVNYAKQQIGAEYHYAGTSPKTGFDCSGLTSYVMKEFKIKLSPASAEQAKQGVSIPLDKVQPGDLVIFGEKNRIQHVAMVIERNKSGIYCIHSTNSRGVVVDNITTSKYWQPLTLYARDVISGQL